MKRMILLAFILFTGIKIVTGQNTTEWATYLEGYEITEIDAAGDNLWLTDGKEVIKFDRNTAVAVFYGLDDIEKSPDYVITSIKCDNNRLPWIAVTSVGLLKMDEHENWILHSPVSDAHSDLATHIFISDNDVVWTWTTTPVHDPLGSFWTGYEGNRILTRYEGNQVDTFQLEGRISSVAEDKDGNLWIAEWENDTTYTGDLLFSPFAAIVKYDGQNWTTYYLPEEYVWTPSRLTDITFDESGNIWVDGSFGLLDGRSKLVQFNQSDWQVFELPEDAHWMTSLALQDNGAIWMGSSSIGLMKFRNSQWTVYDTEHSEPNSEDIYCIFIDENETKWIGTGNGLAAYNENGFNFPEEPTDSSENELKTSTDIYSKRMNEIELFPNPANDFIILKMPGEIQKSIVEILNIQGKVMKSFSLQQNQNRLDISSFPAGIYIMRTYSDKNQILKKFVKQ